MNGSPLNKSMARYADHISFKQFPLKNFIKTIGIFLGSATIILVIWQIASSYYQNQTLLPGPLVVAQTFYSMVMNGTIIEHTFISLGRILISWLLAALIAIPIGVILGNVTLLERIMRPFIEMIRPISPLAWIPMAILWFGIGLSGKVFIIFIASFFPILLNTISGVQNVNPVLLRAAKSFGCSSIQMTFKVVIPAALPAIATGLRISFGSAWMAIIAAEMVASKSGLGYMIINGMEILRSDIVITGMVITGILGFIFDSIFRFTEKRII